MPDGSLDTGRAPLSAKRAVELVRLYVQSLVSGFYLLTFGWTKRSGREAMRGLVASTGLWNLRSRLPIVAVDQLIPVDHVFRVREPAFHPVNVSLHELCVIGALIGIQGPSTLLEIGTFDGRTTLNMVENAPPEARVYTIDLPSGPVADMGVLGTRFMGRSGANQITQLLDDSTSFDFASLGEEFQFVFVDGSHEYLDVLSDSKTALALVNMKGGVILWHDYGGFVGPTRALDELWSTHPAFAGLVQIQGTSLAYLDVPASVIN